MVRNLGTLARELSIAQIQTLLTIKQRLVEMEKLQNQLQTMDAQITQLARSSRTGRGKTGGRKGRGRRRTATLSATTRRRRVGRPAASLKGAARPVLRRGRTTRKAAARVGKGNVIVRRGRGKGGKSLEQTIVDLLKSNAKPMKFPDIKTTILRRKLFKTRSKNFDNVLRRTISSSRVIRRISRGVYNA
jgi:hypothetical protein